MAERAIEVKFSEITLLVILLCCSSLADGWFVERSPYSELVTIEFRETDLVQALRQLDEHLDGTIYIGSDVRGLVTGHYSGVPLEDVLRSLLAQQSPALGYKRVGSSTLVVARPEKLVEPPITPDGRLLRPGQIVEEFLLEGESIDRVIRLVSSRYPDIELLRHPIVNGFWAIGVRRDIEALRRELEAVEAP